MRFKPWISVFTRQQRSDAGCRGGQYICENRQSYHFGTIRAGSRDDIEKTAALPVLRLHDPNIRIETDLAGELLFGFGRIDPEAAMKPREKPALAILHFALRRRSEQRDETVEPVDLDKNRAGLGRAAPAQYGAGAFMRAVSEIGRHPKIGA
jgi:hypothetical protein